MPYNTDRCLIRVCDAIFECGKDCPYGKGCNLKLVQNGLPRDLEVCNPHKFFCRNSAEILQKLMRFDRKADDSPHKSCFSSGF